MHPCRGVFYLTDPIFLRRLKNDYLSPHQVKISRDAIASTRTQGLIGDNYIKIIPGGDEEMLADGEGMLDTQSAIVLEPLVSKYVFMSY